MKISVLEKDIKLGLRTITSSTKCPVARAIRRAGFRGISVGVTMINTKYNRVELPMKAVAAISYMCTTHTMKPFTFYLTKKQISSLRGN